MTIHHPGDEPTTATSLNQQRITIDGVTPELRARFGEAAHAYRGRAGTRAQYIEALLDLHEAVKRWIQSDANDGEADLVRTVERLGLVQP